MVEVILFLAHKIGLSFIKKKKKNVANEWEVFWRFFARKENQRCVDRKMEENRNSVKIKAVNLKSVKVSNILDYLVISMHFEFFLPSFIWT